MANTFTKIQTITCSGGETSFAFNSIPSTYTDLMIKVSARLNSSTGTSGMSMRFNGTTAGYYNGIIDGDGATLTGQEDINIGQAYVGRVPSAGATASSFSNFEIYIPNYASNNYKTYSSDSIGPTNASTNQNALSSGGTLLSTTPITSISLYNNTYAYAQYSSATLYGISKPDQTGGVGSKATGGVVTTSGSYTIHTFTSTGTFTPTTSMNVDYLVVAGGGGSINDNEGGGGGGGVLAASTFAVTSGTSYACLVGAGGSVNMGSTSAFSSIVATGGGSSWISPGTTAVLNGGSGAGGWSVTTLTAGTGISGQGFGGGVGANVGATNVYVGGGGGGATAAGTAANSTTKVAGSGGAGYTSTISGTSTVYAGGGGGGCGSGGAYAAGQTPGSGGAGGGTAGSNGQTQPTNGTANTGGGAGSPGFNASYTLKASTGGSGIVIVRYTT